MTRKKLIFSMSSCTSMPFDGTPDDGLTHQDAFELLCNDIDFTETRSAHFRDTLRGYSVWLSVATASMWPVGTISEIRWRLFADQQIIQMLTHTACVHLLVGSL